MRFNNILLSSALCAILFSSLNAFTGDQNQTNDNYNNMKKGWNLYFDTKNQPEKVEEELKKEPVSKQIELDILQKILDESRKQTKIQEKILLLLEEEIDPKPKEVVVNGKKCIANSSADCFVLPMISEAKRVPVMAEFLKDPYDLKKAAEYMRWQAGLFNNAINIGNALQFAYAQWGEKVYPVGAQTPSYSSLDGAYEAKILPEAEKELILSKKDTLSFSIFIGKNPNMDIFSAKSIMDVIAEYGQMDIELIYFDQKSKEIFEGAISSVYDIKKLKNWNLVKKQIDPKKFDAFNIHTSPSFVAKIKGKDKNEAQTILNGKVDTTSFRSRTIGFMEIKKLIDYSNFSESKAWQNNAAKQYVIDYYKGTQNTDIKGITK